MSPIRYINLEAQWHDEKQQLLPIIEEVMASGIFVGGPKIGEFEEIAAERCGSNYCVALNSGTDALVCGMVALGIGRGDEVITPPNSFIASTAAVVHIGAKPVFVDVTTDQLLDVDAVEEAITSRTKAIMPVHLTGRMVAMDRLMAIADKHGLLVIEDAAQSIGSKYQGVCSGAYGHVGCFSTHPLKNLNACGDGGFVVTKDKKVADKIRAMANHGLIDRNTVREFGYVSRMDALQAAILAFRLSKLDEVIARRRNNAKLYTELLNEDVVYIAGEPKEYFNTFHTFVVQVDHRDALVEHLAQHNVQTAIHYPIPIHLQPASRNLGYRENDFIHTERQANRILTLPINQFITNDDIAFVSEKVNDFLA